MDDYLKTNTDIGRGILFFASLAAIIVALIITFFGWLRPMWLSQEHNSFTESHQYIEARKTEVIADIGAYDKLTVDIAKYENLGKSEIVDGLKDQRKSLEIKIKAALSKIPEKEWPSGSEKFK